MKRFAAFALMLALPGCGMHPLYSNGAHGTVGAFYGSVSVQGIEGKNGWLMHQALVDRLGEAGSTQARYQLETSLDDKILGTGITTTNIVTRERRSLRARFQLIDLQTGQTVLDDTAGSDESIDVVSSEYATIAAENSAIERLSQTVADQIVGRIAVYARHQAKAQ
ncbi:MAG: hypothetical protein KGQ42_05675 [Alphaproteobacteria bacterium]|nr:hypothetical protein [Alphaproteobacteria bacterium]MDE2340576.1 hypothetical protein [Alphaproteobacteria bacterium]